MARLSAFALLPLLSFAASFAAADPAKPAPTQDQASVAEHVDMDGAPKVSPEAEARFRELVAKGDRARRSFRPGTAANAYSAALAIKDDPLVSGRMGLALVMARNPSMDHLAASYLYSAVSNAAGSDDAERNSFWEAYKRLREHVCRFDIISDNVGVMISHNDEEPRAKGVRSFWKFVNPGIHKFRGALPGHADIKHEVECIDGRRQWVRFDFSSDGEAPQPVRESSESASSGLTSPSSGPPQERRSPFRTGIGAAMVFGAAPSPSLGAAIVGEYRPGMFSVMAMARGAWSLRTADRVPVDVFTATAQVGPCAHWQWLMTCGFAGINVFDHRIERNLVYRARMNRQAIPGFGLGIGASYRIGQSLSARIFADAMVLTRNAMIEVTDTEETLHLWRTHTYMFSASASLIFGR